MMELETIKKFSLLILFFLLPGVGLAQQQQSSGGHCGKRMGGTAVVWNDAAGITQKVDISLNTAFGRLQEQINTIRFDSEEVKDWISDLDPGKVNLPWVDEEQVIEDVAEAAGALIDQTEDLLKNALTTARGSSETALRKSFTSAMKSFAPGGNFKADISYLKDCCATTGYWSGPSVQLAGRPTAVKGIADFEVKVGIGGSVGIEATTEASMKFGLELELALTKWSDWRFWPPASGENDSSNRKGCSVQVRSQPNWKASYIAKAGGGALLTVVLGVGATADNTPKLPEVTTSLSIGNIQNIEVFE